jgi:hypothetical protein
MSGTNTLNASRNAGGQSGLQTRTGATESVSLCVPNEILTAFVELESPILLFQLFNRAFSFDKNVLSNLRLEAAAHDSDIVPPIGSVVLGQLRKPGDGF